MADWFNFRKLKKRLAMVKKALKLHIHQLWFRQIDRLYFL